MKIFDRGMRREQRYCRLLLSSGSGRSQDFQLARLRHFRRPNPYHDPRGWRPLGSNGDRDRSAPGLLNSGSEAVKIFMRHGWIWDGLLDLPDYMHFGKVTVGGESNPFERPVWASQLQPAPK
jgi:hypothetical protein